MIAADILDASGNFARFDQDIRVPSKAVLHQPACGFSDERQEHAADEVRVLALDERELWRRLHTAVACDQFSIDAAHDPDDGVDDHQSDDGE